MSKRKRTVVINKEIVAVQEQQVQMFQEDIEKMVDEHDMDYLEAILAYCTLRDIEIETVSALISPALYKKIYSHCAERNMIKVTQDQFTTE